MPPLLPRPSICGLQAAFSSCRISIPSSSSSNAAAASSWRAFATTSSTQRRIKPRAIPVPPESPKFIVLPEPPQSVENKLPPIRGHLPVPRTVFTRRDGARKAKKAFVQNATPKSDAQLANLPPKSAQESQRRALAAVRRHNLAAGIQGLYVRKKLADARTARRSKHNARLHEEARTRPTKPDVYLNQPSVLAEATLAVPHQHDPNRFRVALGSRDRTAHKLKVKAESRKDALAQLYVAAKNFIVDDDDLVAAVESAFVPEKFITGSHGSGSSHWAQHGAPPSIAELQISTDAAYPVSNMIQNFRNPALKTTERQKLVAEELTGGKLGGGSIYDNQSRP